MNLGVIGLGMMGRAMARNLLRAGHRVTVWNRTRSRAEKLQALGQRTIVVGTDPVAAPIVKLVGNFLLASAVESLAEAMALLRKSGTDAQACLNTLTDTLFAAPVYKNYAGLMLEQHYDPGFRLALGLKDVRLVLEAAASFDVPMPVAGLVRDRLLVGVARGYQDKDLAALALVCAEEAGLHPVATFNQNGGER